MASPWPLAPAEPQGHGCLLYGQPRIQCRRIRPEEAPRWAADRVAGNLQLGQPGNAAAPASASTACRQAGRCVLPFPAAGSLARFEYAADGSSREELVHAGRHGRAGAAAGPRRAADDGPEPAAELGVASGTFLVVSDVGYHLALKPVASTFGVAASLVYDVAQLGQDYLLRPAGEALGLAGEPAHYPLSRLLPSKGLAAEAAASVVDVGNRVVVKPIRGTLGVARDLVLDSARLGHEYVLQPLTWGLGQAACALGSAVSLSGETLKWIGGEESPRTIRSPTTCGGSGWPAPRPSALTL